MDDPWANAWGEPTKPSPDSLPSSSAWSAPPVPTIHGDHASGGDLSLPSWSTQPTAAQWSDPDTAEALWSDDISTVWNPFPSTVDKVSLSADSIASQLEIEVSPPVLSEDVPELRPPSRSVSLTPEDDTPPASSTADSSDAPPHSPQLTTPVPPPLLIGSVEDLDAFGTFETANEDADSEEWSSSKPSLSLPSADAAVWGGSWEGSSVAASVDAKSEASTELDDAWEVARQQKEKQDQHVPPELLASILQQFEDLSGDLWPNSVPSSTSSHDTQLPMDMEEHLGLAPIVLKLVPRDLTLPASVPFPKTFTSKQMSEALKMTRHAPLTRISPMSFYMSSKGLTSWEASVKAKPNIVQEDFTPAGWKILENGKAEVLSTEDVKKKPNGGLLSFFGRRTTNSASENIANTRSASPISNSGTSSVKPGTSPRPSIDSGRRSISQSQTGGSTAPSSPSVASFGGNTPAILTKDTNPLSDNNAISTVMSPVSQEIEMAPQPSAVSRFLGRFSSRSAKSSNSQDSLTLSPDDLEFLSDVPTIDTSPDTSTGLDALSMMIKSPPIPTALPPPLKPPPRAPPQISRTVPKEQPPVDDFLSFFDNGSEHVPSGPSLSPLKPAPTPPVIVLTQLPSSSTQALATNHTSNTVKSSEQTSQTNESNTDQSWPSFDYPMIPMSKPAPTKRPFVAIMATSSSKTSSTPPLLPKPTSGFVLSPPPPLSRRTTTSSGAESSSILPLPPPPTSRAPTPSRPLEQPSLLPPPLTTTINDEDDFADFLSSPSDTAQTTQLSFGDFAPSRASVKQSTSTQHQQTSTGNLFDDFDDFIDPPPQPPAKSSPPKSFSPPTHSPAVPKNSNHGSANNHKPIRVANHSKTLSLMENVAARGRWLAPPSPLPEALPPPETTNSKSSTVDFFSTGSSMQAQQAQVTASLAAAAPSRSSNEKPPSWNFPPPSNRTFLTPILQSTQATFSESPSKPQPLLQPLVAQTGAPTSTGTKTGGLSAQDLSFFEGL
ncbi:hypothetical protein CVT25_010147 [Psilocybe cyanescens]|uniref:Uncharacterized protein n=1 Tax=Psilocybe cyanescens TaxID=93625 RepID=A0A409XJ47_PSICY|nr:hypothetical protein CVT25_010147 [Psilocybe cyanescens]